ncbi:MAG TPA: manganese efflux pump [Epulopiscium sp.]|nr:manganese efflux pump [Candidatus Epulonipiscium sp.]
MNFVIMILTGVSLAMDAFAVSISCGLSCRITRRTLPTAMKIALYFGFFQGIMILAGWIFGLSFKDFISAYDHWVAFILLVIIGGKMIHDSVEEGGCNISLDSTRTLLTLSIATSIDALAIGVSFSVLGTTLLNISLTAIIVAVITFLFCFGGTYIGAKIGCDPKFKTKIDITGGLILIFLGIKILLESTLLA